jgi:hypothetical protein
MAAPCSLLERSRDSQSERRVDIGAIADCRSCTIDVARDGRLEKPPVGIT